MRAALAFPAVAAAVALALPLLAQGERENPTGSRVGRGKAASIPQRAGMSEIDKARMTVESFADCNITNEPRKAAAYRDMKYDDPRAIEFLKALASRECLWNASLHMPTDLLRGAMFKSFYQREVKAGDRPFGDTAMDFATFLNDPRAPASRQYLILMDFADCVVRADAADARAFILAEPASSIEKSSLANLQKHFGPCFPAGAEVTLNKSIVSAVLAEALYREAENARTTMAEASH